MFILCRVGLEDRFDLVLMDIRMPFISGLLATAEIKNARPDLPIIARSAHAGKEEIDTALEAGCDDT